MPGHNQRLGASGEALAAAWYTTRGYEVLARNWRCAAGELDLVVRRGPVVAFVEVKARSTDAFGVPAEAVTAAKQARLRRLAAAWLREEATTRAGDLRFDVACVLDGRLEIIEGAF